MAHSLTLDIPEEIYQPLAETAKRVGQTPEQLAAEWLVSVVHQFADDPLLKFIGAFDTDGSDWADKHDEYIGRSLMEENGNVASTGE